MRRCIDVKVSWFCLCMHIFYFSLPALLHQVEQLRAINDSSAILAGFTMSCFVEVPIPENCDSQLILWFAFMAAVSTGLLLLSAYLATILIVAVYKCNALLHMEKSVDSFNIQWKQTCQPEWEYCFICYLYGTQLPWVWWLFIFCKFLWAYDRYIDMPIVHHINHLGGLLESPTKGFGCRHCDSCASDIPRMWHSSLVLQMVCQLLSTCKIYCFYFMLEEHSINSCSTLQLVRSAAFVIICKQFVRCALARCT